MKDKKMKMDKKMIISIVFVAIVFGGCIGIGGYLIGTGNPFVGFAIVSFVILFSLICGKKKELKAPEMNDELIQHIQGRSAHLTVEVTFPVICILFLAVATLPIEISATHAVDFFFVFYMVVYFVSLRHYTKKYT